MNNFYALVHQANQRHTRCDRSVVSEIVELYRDCIRDAMLNRIVMFGGDPVFQSIAAELASVLDIDVREATQLLWSPAHAIYNAAASVQSTGLASHD